QLNDLKRDLAELKSGSAQLKKDLDRFIDEREENLQDPYAKIMIPFLTESVSDLQRLSDQVQFTERTYADALRYFGEGPDPKRRGFPAVQAMKTEDFFGIFKEFCASYRKAKTDNVRLTEQRVIEARRRAAAEEKERERQEAIARREAGIDDSAVLETLLGNLRAGGGTTKSKRKARERGEARRSAKQAHLNVLLEGGAGGGESGDSAGLGGGGEPGADGVKRGSLDGVSSEPSDKAAALLAKLRPDGPDNSEQGAGAGGEDVTGATGSSSSSGGSGTGTGTGTGTTSRPMRRRERRTGTATGSTASSSIHGHTSSVASATGAVGAASSSSSAAAAAAVSGLPPLSSSSTDTMMASPSSPASGSVVMRGSSSSNSISNSASASLLGPAFPHEVSSSAFPTRSTTMMLHEPTTGGRDDDDEEREVGSMPPTPIRRVFAEADEAAIAADEAEAEAALAGHQHGNGNGTGPPQDVDGNEEAEEEEEDEEALTAADSSGAGDLSWIDPEMMGEGENTLMP
ncbi:hypothetical protein A4X03_0g5925, partial [Tilletia caries]